MGGAERPSRLERFAYRSLGIRLDERWQSWVRSDLDDPKWGRRHRLTTTAVFGCIAVVLAVGAYAILGRVLWSGYGGLVGALLGQVLRVETRRRQVERVQFGPRRNPFTAGLAFRERLTMTASIVVLALAVLAVGAFALRDANDDRFP